MNDNRDKIGRQASEPAQGTNRSGRTGTETDMGERLSGDGLRGRRRVRPGGTLSDPRDAGDDTALEAALAAAVRADDHGPQGERQAVAAFRAAHAAGAYRVSTRRRDDWRPAAERRVRRPVRLTFGVVCASLALGGVAVAAIGSVGSSTEGAGHGRGTPNPSATAPNRPGGAASAPSSGKGRPTDRPATDQETEAHCRAYDQVQGHGKALDATAWKRLIAAAGGTDKVAAYCAEQLAAATAKPSRSTGSGKSGKSAGNSAATAGATAAAGNGRANGGRGNGKNK
ncbi:hypothetical protein SAMN05216533_4069 [Streptomyces sp. Ag109_O5-10]|nr:hypothetical protein SAMN05216533_4069 [Streptomyces sp. Ag109_O5-10]